MLARRAAAQDHILRPLVVTGALALGILAPRGHRMTATRGTTFTTTMRLVDRVHRHTAAGRANAEPALAAGLSQLGVLVVRVGHRTDGGHAIGLPPPLLARGQTQHGHPLVLADQLARKRVE